MPRCPRVHRIAFFWFDADMDMPILYGHGGGETRPFFGQQVKSAALGDGKRDDFKDINLPMALLNLFSDADTELYVDALTIMCPNSIRHYLKHNQERLVDFGFEYLGMGHVRVYSYDVNTVAVVTRIDGGANYLDREENARQRLIIDIDSTEKIPFAEWYETNISQPQL